MSRLSNLSSAFVVCFCSLTSSGFAQEGPRPKIIVVPPPGQVVWSVNFTYTKTKDSLRSENKEAIESNQMKADDLDRIEKITYTIKKPVSSRITTYDGGRKEEAFQYEGHEFSKPRGSDKIINSDISSYPDPEELFTKKFPGVHWVKPKLFVKVENAYGEPCAIFREAEAVLTAAQREREDINADQHLAREAWFSIKTGLPVAFKENGTTGRFNFGDPATADVKIPQDVREVIAKYAAYVDFVKKRNAP